MSPEPLLPGLRVIEIGQYVAAPFAATIFADQGADVVKIERPGRRPVPRRPGPVRGVEPREVVGHPRPRVAGRPSRGARADRRCRRAPGEPPARRAGPPRAGAGRAPGPQRRPRDRLDLGVRQPRAGTRRPRVGAARPRARGWAAGSLHRGPADVAALPDGERRGRAVRGARRGRRTREARDDRLRPARRDLAVRGDAVPQRGPDLPLRAATAGGRAPGAHAGAAHVPDERRPRHAGEPQRHRALARGVQARRPRRRRRARLREPPVAREAHRSRMGQRHARRRDDPLRGAHGRRMGAGPARDAGGGVEVQHDRGVARPRAVTRQRALRRHRRARARNRAARRPARPGAHRRSGPGRAPPSRLGGRRPRRAPRRRHVELLGRPARGAAAGRARRGRGQGGAAGWRGCVPADAGAAEHLRRRQPLQARDDARPARRRGPRPPARPGRARPTSSSRTPWRGRGSASGSARSTCRGQPGRGPRPREGVRAARTARGAAVVRLRRAGRDRHGDDPGRRRAATDELHRERLLHRRAPRRGRRARVAGTGTRRGGLVGRGVAHDDGHRVPVRARGRDRRARPAGGRGGRRAPRAGAGVPPVRGDRRVDRDLRRDSGAPRRPA